MSRIFAKSPYIIEINEASQIGAKVEIYLKKPQNGVVVYPTLPSYTLSKLIASSNAPTCYFDISEYIQNFLNPDFGGTPAVSCRLLFLTIFHIFYILFKYA
jgi:hypothetical protein